MQRAMGIGYGRAARLIDFMAEDGYVGPYNGSKAREVMLTEAQWHNIQAGDPNPVNDEDWPDEEEAVVEALPEVKRSSPKPKVAKSKVFKSKPAKPKSRETTPREVAEQEPEAEAKSKSTSSPQRKKLLRLEPGQETLRSANTSFAPAPKRKLKIKPDEELHHEELEDEELEEEEEYEDYEDFEDDEVEASGEDDEYEYVYEDEEEDAEYDESDYEDADEYEDVEEEE